MKTDPRPTRFNRENLDFALANILAFKFRSLLTILGIIVGIVTVVLVASVLVGVRRNIALLFQEFGPNNIFAYHLNGDPGNPTVKPEELTRKPLRAEFARLLLDACPSLEDTAVRSWCPTWWTARVTARYRGPKTPISSCRGPPGTCRFTRNWSRAAPTPGGRASAREAMPAGGQRRGFLFPGETPGQTSSSTASLHRDRRVPEAQGLGREPAGQRGHGPAQNRGDALPRPRNGGPLLPGPARRAPPLSTKWKGNCAGCAGWAPTRNRTSSSAPPIRSSARSTGSPCWCRPARWPSPGWAPGRGRGHEHHADVGHPADAQIGCARRWGPAAATSSGSFYSKRRC